MALKAIYTKSRHSLFWHFCINCEGWPRIDFDEVTNPDDSATGLSASNAKTYKGSKNASWSKRELSRFSIFAVTMPESAYG
jgi:hypothetical protein